MLDRADQRANLKKWIDSLPCLVHIPPDLLKTFDTEGVPPSLPDDQRRFARSRCRSLDHRAALETRTSLPGLEREQSWHAVYPTDISNNGLQFFHCDRLYPGETLRVALITGGNSAIEVTWCCRKGPQCFATGAKFVKQTEATDGWE